MDEWKYSLSQASTQASKVQSHKATSQSSSAQSKAKRNEAQLLCRQRALIKLQELEEKELRLKHERQLLNIQTDLQMNDILLETENQGTCSNESVDLSLPEEEKHDVVRKWLHIGPPGVSPQFPPQRDASQLGSTQLGELTPQVEKSQLTLQVDPPQFRMQFSPSDESEVCSSAKIGEQVNPWSEIEHSARMDKEVSQRRDLLQNVHQRLSKKSEETYHVELEPPAQFRDFQTGLAPIPKDEDHKLQMETAQSPNFGSNGYAKQQTEWSRPYQEPVNNEGNKENMKSPIPDQDLRSDVVGLMREQGNLTRLLMEHQMRALLPQRSIKAFGGDALEYVSFIRAFEHNIESKIFNEKDKLYYLDQYTINDANKLVKSCMHMEEGFSKAKQLLQKKFGGKYKIAEAFVKKATSWPEVKADDATGLNSFSLFLIECRNVLMDLNYISELDHTTNIKVIVMKLPHRLRDKWRFKVDQIMEVEGDAVRFSDLVDFVERQSRILSNPIYGDVTSRESRKIDSRSPKGFSTYRRNRGSSSFATNIAPSSQDKRNEASSRSDTQMACMYCDSNNHDLATCRKLEPKSNKEKIDFLKSKGMCFGCLKRGTHISKDCKKRLTCKKCSFRHPTILHRDGQPPKEMSPKTAEADQRSKNGTSSQADIRSAGSKCTPLNGAGMPAMVPVKVHSRQTGRTVTTYAFLDDGSNAVFCSENLRSQLGITGKKTKLQVQTLLEDQQVDTIILSDLEISDMEGQNTIQLPNVYTQDQMPVKVEDAITAKDIEQWPYLSHINLHDCKAEVSEVGLLIGSNVPKATEPWEVIHSQNEGPYAYKTLLGWVVCGLKGNGTITSNRVLVKSDLHQQLVDMFNHDFNEKTVDDQPEKSVEDKRFMESVSSTIKYTDGHYEIGLPLRERDIKMPNNKARAEERAAHLKQKLKKNPEFCEDYTNFMEDMISNEYAEEVPHEEYSSECCKWYIPHHGVYHPQKKKLRVVFDCSAKYGGTSLNDQLLQGPDYQG